MKATDVQEGQYITRVHDDGRVWGIGKHLTITRSPNGDLWYYKNGSPESKLRKDSSAYNYDDFYLCDNLGNRLSYGQTPLTYQNTSVIVLKEKTGSIASFVSEEEAHNWIREELNRNNLLRFKVWVSPSYEIVPKKLNIQELIHKF